MNTKSNGKSRPNWSGIITIGLKLLLCAGLAGIASAATFEIYPTNKIQTVVTNLQAGDTLYLHAGRYHEEVVCSNLNGTANSPITIASYPGELAILDGTVALTGTWTKLSNHIYQLTLQTNVPDIWQLFVDGEAMVNARWPNVGFVKGDPLATHSNYWSRSPSNIGQVLLSAPTVTNGSSLGNMIDNGDAGLASTGFSAEGGIIVIQYPGYAETIPSRVTRHTAGTPKINYDTNNIPDFEDYLLSAANDNTALESGNHAYYWLEGKLQYLDAPGEWFYDATNRIVYVWTPDGDTPTNHAVRGKNMTYAFQGSVFMNVQFQNLNFFGTTIVLDGLKSCLLENLNFQWGAYQNRMTALQYNVAGLWFNTLSKGKADGTIFRNIRLEHSDSNGFYVETGGADWTFDNILVNDTAWTSATFEHLVAMPFDTGAGGDSGDTVRRITVSHSGLRNGTKGHVVQYFHCFDIGRFLQRDGAATECSQPSYCWSHDHSKLGFRFDGTPKTVTQLNPVDTTMFHSSHHNVSWNVNHQMYKGESNLIANVFALWPPAGDTGFEIQNVVPGENANTLLANLGGICDPPEGTMPGNKHAIVDREIANELVDPANFDFRPRAGSVLIDAGVQVTGLDGSDLTAGFVGAAPDIGPYEYGDDKYWIPGFQEAFATMPIPPDGAKVNRNVDLMWLIGYKGTQSLVYYGDNSNAVQTSTISNVASGVFSTNFPDPKNIFSPVTLGLAFAPGQSYFWKVDTVHQENGTNVVVPGPVWKILRMPDTPPIFSANPLAMPLATANNPYADSLVGDASDPDAGDLLTFSKVSGPTWLAVGATTGTLTGTPGNADVGTNYFVVRVTDAAGLFAEATMIIPVWSYGFAPMADAYVYKAKPTNNYGSDGSLNIKGQGGITYLYQSYLMFNVQEVTQAVSSAKLRLFTTVGGTTARLYAVPTTTWTEGAITWSNKLDFGPLISSQPIGTGQWVEFDVSAFVITNGKYSYAVDTADNSLYSFSSKEGGNPPQLVLLAPVPQARIASLHFESGTLRLGGNGAAGRPYVLLTATNLAPVPAWIPVATNLADTNGVFQFNDPAATNYPQRFYKVRYP